MKEYGGYIEFEYFHGEEYHKKAIALNSGRHCVEYLIRLKKIRKLYLPLFMCDSVKAVCDKLGVKTEYYHTDIHFLPVFGKILDEGEWLYAVNYYGQLSNADIAEMKNRHGNIIIDNVQAFFQMPVDGVDTLYTCRKFFGVADGGYLYTDGRLKEKLETDISYDRMSFLLGRFEKGANEFYPNYVANNKMFAGEPLKRMSKLTRNIMRGADYKKIRRIRAENFAYLHEMFREVNKLNLEIPEGAFMYPLYIDSGAEIRRQLQMERIYVPTLWPDVFEVCGEDELEYDMAKNILPLPVDQRYTARDMEFITKEVMRCCRVQSGI